MTIPMEEIDDLVCDTKAILFQLPEAQILDAYKKLNITPPGNRVSRYKLIQVMEQYMSSILEKEEAEALLTEMLCMVKSCFMPSKEQVESSTNNEPTESKQNSAQMPRKDLKISGAINGSEGISFVNIIRQIETARDKPYSDKEIVWAVVRAIHPSQQLRGYLEGRSDLTLPVLRKLLRSYYKEQSATELYIELTQGSQGQKEEVLDFIWRMLDLGQKVSFASEEEGSTLNYDRKLVRQMTLRTIHTGLREPAVALDLKSVIISNPNDEDLTQEVNRVVAENEERQKKQKARSGPRIAPVVIEEPSHQPAPSTSDVSFKELQAEVQALRKELLNQKKYRPPPACSECQQSGTKCDHCLICGSAEHFKAGCKQRRSGNARGSVIRGSH